MFRIQNEQSKAMDRAGRMREGGMFNSAASAEIRGERRAEQRAEEANVKQFLRDQYGTGNFGDAFREFDRNNNISGWGSTRKLMELHGYEPELGESSSQAFERMVRDQAKSESERKEEEVQRSGGAGGGSGSAPQDKSAEIVGKLSELITEVKERLPQNALAA
jgi:hypothetical protein